MGGAVSAGEDNDELIDNLVTEEYIKSHIVEKAFRAVDRGKYFLEECRENAYRDLAWKNGNIHISAPCIYSEVMESLKLGPGMSFLNLGSGTGYLSTMAGLILGPYGINHGIELHQSNVDYAQNILEDFQNSSPALDKYEFCPPAFVAGNCLLLDSSVSQYDRVYCGASCPNEHENFIKNLVRVGGILVMPINDNLLQVIRTSETTFDVRNVLPVSFASLVVPSAKDCLIVSVKLPEKNPLQLQEICRTAVRVILRKFIEMENPSLTVKRVIKTRRKKGKRQLRRIVIPLLEENRGRPLPPLPLIGRSLPPLPLIGKSLPPLPLIGKSLPPLPLISKPRVPLKGDRQEEISQDVEVDMDEAGPSGNQDTTNQCDDNDKFFYDIMNYPKISHEVVVINNEAELTTEMSSRENMELRPNAIKMKQENVEKNGECSSVCKSGRLRTLTANGDSGIDNISDDSLPEEYPSDSDKNDDSEYLHTVDDGHCDDRPGNSNYLKRSAEENGDEGLPELTSVDGVHRRYPHCRGSTVIFKRVAFSDPESDELEEIDSDSDNEDRLPRYDEKSYLSRYTFFMKQKINQLPVPHALKVYLNLSRPVY